MKKYLAIALVATGVLALAGCQEKEDTASRRSSENTEMTSSSVAETQASESQASTASTEASAPASSTTEASQAAPSGDLQATTINGLSGNTYQLDLPADWTSVAGFESVNPDADFLHGNADQTRLISVIAEPKADFADFDTYVDLVSQNIEATSGKKPTFKNLDKFKGKETEFAATVQGMNFNYIYYVIETDNNFMQLYSWSFASEFDQARPELIDIMDSFKVTAE